MSALEAKVLGHNRGLDSVSALKNELNDPDWHVPIYKFEGFAKSGNLAVIPLLKKELKDPDVLVRFQAAEILCRSGDQLDMPVLFSSLKGPYRDLDRYGAASFGIPGNWVFAKSINTIEGFEWPIRLSAEEALEKKMDLGFRHSVVPIVRWGY
jgi:hypothetical protein